MKAKISRTAAHMLVLAWVLEDRKTDPASDSPAVEAWSYLESREEGFIAPFDLDQGNLQLVYDTREGAWYLQDDPHAEIDEEIMRRIKKAFIPTWL